MRLFAWFLALMLLVLATWMIWGSAWEQRFSLQGAVQELEATGSWAWALGVGLLIGDVILPIPGTVVMSALGWIYGALLGGVIASIGSILAGLSAYGLGRLFGEPAARKILGTRDFDRGQHLFSRAGGWVVCLSRALPLLPEAVACTAGLVRMPFHRFLLSLACGSLPMGFVFAWVGASGKETPAVALALSMGIPVILWAVARKLLGSVGKPAGDLSAKRG